MKKIISALLLVAAVSGTQARPSSEDAILTLTCNVSYESRKADEDYKPDGPPISYTVTVYKKNNNYFIKQQNGSYNPTWWGEGVTWSGLSYTVSNFANLNTETIWARATTKSIDGILNDHYFEINRVNGFVKARSTYPKSNNSPETRILMNGRCFRSTNAF